MKVFQRKFESYVILNTSITVKIKKELASEFESYVILNTSIT